MGSQPQREDARERVNAGSGREQDVFAILRPAGGSVRAWLAENTFMPEWVPRAWRHPATCYVLAAVAQALGVLVSYLITLVYPEYALLGMLELLVVATVSIGLGAGPGVLATLIGAVLLQVVVLRPQFSWRLTRDGSLVEVSLFLVIGCVIVLVVSATERGRRRALMERAESQARELALRETNDRMDEFFSIASHELRSPLTAIKATVQLAERRVRRVVAEEHATPRISERLEPVLELLERVERQVGLENRLVSDLLDVSRIRANKLEYRFTRTDLVPIVEDAVDEQRLGWPGRIISLETPDSPVPVYADVDRTGQVVKNYLSNALKYSGEGTPVDVRVEVLGGAARVSVRDRGPGLTHAEQERVWDRFGRINGVRQLSGSAGSLGLGLYICRTIVERHEGAVGIESAKGHGATFWFTLPLATATAATDSAATDSAAAETLSDASA